MRICLICKRNKSVKRTNCMSEKWYRYKGGYICHSCYTGVCNKQNTQIRNGKLSKHSYTGKGFISEQIIAKYLNIENENIRNDKFAGGHVDLVDINIGNIDVKSCKLKFFTKVYKGIETIHTGWTFDTNNKKVDKYIFVGFNEERNEIIKVWMIPVNNISSLAITIYFSVKGLMRYKEYEFSSVEVEKLNSILHSIGKDCKYLCDINK